MTLTNPTDDELDAAFAEKVAGWTHYEIPGVRTIWYNGILSKDGLDYRLGGPPLFTPSADAVLPWLEKHKALSVCRVHRLISPGVFDNSGPLDWRVTINGVYSEHRTFPRAAVIALLRAHGVEVVFTK